VEAKFACRRFERITEARADGVRDRDMRDAAGPEEALFARKGAVDELVDDDEGAGRQLSLQRSYRGQRDDLRHAAALEDVDIGPVVQLGRRAAMAAPMPGKKDDLLPQQLRPHDLIGGRAEGRMNPLPGDVLEAGYVVDPAAADDADDGRLRSGHGGLRWRASEVLPAALWVPPAIVLGQWTSAQTFRLTA